MFNFSDNTTVEYQNYSLFVNEETHQPKPLNEVDASKLPFLLATDIDPVGIFYMDGILTAEECEYLTWLAENAQYIPSFDFPYGDMFWDERSVPFLTVFQKHKLAFGTSHLQWLSLRVHDAMKEWVSSCSGVENFCVEMTVKRFPVDSYQHPQFEPIGDLGRMAHCAIFLNDNYEGGEVFYPYYNWSTEPKTGRVYAHDSGQSHLNGVARVRSNAQYKICSTWTKDPSASNCDQAIKSLRNHLEEMQATGIGKPYGAK
jgi:hypothetical protein